MDKKGQKTLPRGVVNYPVPAAAAPVNSKLYANLPLTPPSTKLIPTDSAMNTIKKVPGVGRGVPPPVPPNKPQIPPKKDLLLNRRADAASSGTGIVSSMTAPEVQSSSEITSLQTAPLEKPDH